MQSEGEEHEGENAIEEHENSEDDRSAQAVAIAVPYPHNLLVRPSCWYSGIWGCYEVWSTCSVACFCPCITFGRVAEAADQGRFWCCLYGTVYFLLSLVCLQCLYSFMFRKKLRAMYSLPEHPCNDLCVHCCCGRCALIQEEREIRYREGWLSPAMAPPVAQELEKRLGEKQMPSPGPQENMATT